MDPSTQLSHAIRKEYVQLEELRRALRDDVWDGPRTLRTYMKKNVFMFSCYISYPRRDTRDTRDAQRECLLCPSGFEQVARASVRYRHAYVTTNSYEFWQIP